MKERLQKYIAESGAASRRKAEQLIFDGRVKVNGSVVKEIIMVDGEYDRVELDGRMLKAEGKKLYIVINKPVGIITSSRDQFGRRTVLDLVDVKERVYPVGRLDYDTSGLLILTNDGNIANRIAHPSKQVEKVYEAEVLGMPEPDLIKRFKEGLKIDDYITSPADFNILERGHETCRVEIVIHEGKNRQVRRMCEAIGHPVIRLSRIKIGDIRLGSLQEGQWRSMTEDEIRYLKSL
jgi:23S rRNA pseudouridine2605 synthase